MKVLYEPGLEIEWTDAEEAKIREIQSRPPADRAKYNGPCVETKICLVCGKAFGRKARPQKPGSHHAVLESPSDFAKRKVCSNECRWAWQRQLYQRKRWAV